jgi:PST family polysaccharide transporter
VDIEDPSGPGADEIHDLELTVATKAGPPGQLSRRTMRGMWFMGASAVTQAGLGILFVGVLAHLIRPGQYGLATGALVAVSLTTILAESGIGSAIVQRKDLHPIHIRIGWTLSVLIGVVCWAVLALLAPAVSSLLRLDGLTPILRVVALIFVINSLTLGNYLLARRLHFGRLALAECTAYAVGYGAVASVLAWRGYGAWALVGGQLGQAVVLNVMSFIFAPHSLVPAFRRQPAKELMAYGTGHTLARFGQWGSVNADDIIVSRFLGQASLGLYGRAYQLVNMPAILFGQVANDVLFPAMSAVQDQRERLRRVFRIGIGFLAGVSLPITAVAVVTSKPLVLLLLGRDWLPLRDAFDVIVFGMLFRTSVKISESLARATGAVYRRAWRTWLFTGLVVAGALAGTPWGLHGVAFGVLGALFANYLLMSHLGMTITGMSWSEFARAHVPGLIVALVAGVTAYAAKVGLHALHLGGWTQLIGIWLVAFVAAWIAVRVAPRTRGLGSLAMLCADLLSFFSGRQGRIARRLVGLHYPAERPKRQAPASELDRVAP